MFVDQAGQGQDIADDHLGFGVAGTGFGTEDEGAGQHVDVRVIHDAVVQRVDVQGVEHLPLVLMQSLDLHVKHGVGVQDDLLPGFDPGGEVGLVMLLDLQELLAEGGVVPEGQQVLQLIGLVLPPGADGFSDQFRQPGVAGHQPAAVGDAVGDISKFLRIDQAVIVEGILLEDVAVQPADPVDAVAPGDAQVGHVHLVISQDGHAGDPVPVARKLVPQHVAQAAVHFLHDHVDARQLTADQVLRPAFQRFLHDGMVGVGHAAHGDLLRLIPAQPFLIHQQAHELRDGEAGMGVVDMEDSLVRQKLKVIAKTALEILERVLQRGAGQKVLLA